MKIAALVPAFNEERNIAAVVQGARPFVSLVLVVDDGSADSTGAAAQLAGAVVIRHPANAERRRPEDRISVSPRPGV